MFSELVRWSASEATLLRVGFTQVSVLGHSWFCHLWRVRVWMSHWVLFHRVIALVLGKCIGVGVGLGCMGPSGVWLWASFSLLQAGQIPPWSAISLVCCAHVGCVSHPAWLGCLMLVQKVHMKL